MKNLFWETNEQLAFRFNLPVLTKAIEEIGAALPFEKTFQKPTLFLRGAKSNYILEDDLDLIVHHFPSASLEIIDNAGHWLHAENPKMFFELTATFLKE